MTLNDLLILMPHLLVGAAAVVAMVAVAIRRNYRLTTGLTLAGLVAALIATVASCDQEAHQVTTLLIVDAYARFYMGLILVGAIVLVALSYRYIAERSTFRDEYYLILLIAVLGCMVLACSYHLVSIFLGVELLSVSLYVLIAYFPSQAKRLEAGVKYLILAAVSVSFLLFGMALVYSALGTMEFSRIVGRLEIAANSVRLMFMAGIALMTVGFGFKLGLAPFHLWVADVYEGAPTPVTAFIATASKGAMFAVMMRFFLLVGVERWKPVFWMFSLIAVASMFVGNLLALRQDNLKRLLGYSSIAHMGYVLVAFLATGSWGTAAVMFYLLAYFITVLGAFGVLILLSDSTDDFQDINGCRGLAFRRPYPAIALMFALFSLAGIPLTSGFIGKFYVLGAGIRQDQVWLVLVMVANSAISLFYYLRVVLALLASPSTDRPNARGISLSAAGVTVGILALLLLWIGIFPASFLALVESAASSLP